MRGRGRWRRRRRRPIGSSAISRLPANYRLLIAAHYLNGVQYEGLAEALQLPLGTVKTQLYRAKQQLRRMLETDLK